MTVIANENDIESAALYINNILVSKGYVRDDERLEFCNENTEKDARTINVIYSLLRTIDDDSKTNESNAQLTREAKRLQEEENTKNERLKAKCVGLEKQVDSLHHTNTTLTGNMDGLKRTLDQYRDQSAKLKSLVKQIRQQFANELRRRDMQIAKLKERLQDSTRRTKTLTGVSGTLSKSYNSYSTTALSVTDSHSEVSEAVSTELSAMNNALVSENSSLLLMLYQIRDSISSVTDENDANIISERTSIYSAQPNDTSEVLTRCKTTQELNAEVSDCIQYITQALHSPNYVSVTELKEKEREIERLKDQLSDANANWQKAVNTMEQWKKYRENRNGIKQPRILRNDEEKQKGGTVSSPARRRTVAATTPKRLAKSEDQTSSSTKKSSSNSTPQRASSAGPKKPAPERSKTATPAKKSTTTPKIKKEEEQ